MTVELNLLLAVCLVTGLVSGSSIDNLEPKHHLRQLSDSGSVTNSEQLLSYLISGCIIFITAISILWINERRHLINVTRLHEAISVCKEINCYDLGNYYDTQLVYTSGKASCNYIAIDQLFGVKISNSMRLERVVENLQWVETCTKRRHFPKSYSYNLQWVKGFKSSRKFNDHGYVNHEEKLFLKSEKFYTTVYLGQYLLSDSLKSQTENYTPINVNNENLMIAANNLNRFNRVVTIKDNCVLLKQNSQSMIEGDLKVEFRYVRCGDISVVSQLTQNTFIPYKFQDEFKNVGGYISNQPQSTNQLIELDCFAKPMAEIDWIFQKILSQQAIFNLKLNKGNLQTWTLRLVGWLMATAGWTLIMVGGTLFTSVSEGRMIEVGLLSGTLLSLLVISTISLFYRPQIGLAMIAFVSFGGILLYLIALTNE